MSNRISVVVLMCLSLSALAQEVAAEPPGPELPPPAAEIKRVQDYLENGKDRGPALLDFIPCLKVDQQKGSPTQFQCVEPVTGPVKKGTTVFMWMQWFTPKDGKYEDVKLQFFHEGEVRQTIDLTVAGYGRTRSFRGHNLTKVGKWRAKISQGNREVGSAEIDVTSN
jgi:hypothetical protein